MAFYVGKSCLSTIYTPEKNRNRVEQNRTAEHLNESVHLTALTQRITQYKIMSGR